MNQRNYWWTGWAAIIAACLVALGAFGAHGLKKHLTIDELQIFETGIRYAWYHLIGLAICDFPAWTGRNTASFKIPAYLFLAGFLMFSGSLIILSLSGIKTLGMVAPIGGLSWIIAWILISIKLFKPEEKRS
jgi:uncharacterized membrane protein YgdD (TMEM256/DUF423 family)